MRKLWISAVLAICCLTGIQIAAAENFAPVVPAAHHGQLVAAPSCGCEAPCAATACNTGQHDTQKHSVNRGSSIAWCCGRMLYCGLKIRSTPCVREGPSPSPGTIP